MTSATRTTPTNGKHAQPRPVRILVDRHQVVGQVMDWQAMAQEAMYANGAALQILIRLDGDPLVYEAVRATHDTHARLSRLISELRKAAGELDGSDPDGLGDHLNHGTAA